MKKTLVTVAQRAKARFFHVEDEGDGLTELEARVHPKARLHEGDLTTDEPGHVQERMGPQSRAYGDHPQAKEHEAETFAKEVAEALAKYRTEEHYQRVIVAAEPGFLGLLRKEMDPATAKLVSAEVDKELTELKTEEIAARMKAVLHT